ncbi:MAG: hypothetical protein J2P36_30160 [Ktedonobacteraceae bacterium]|nr:hypothetical protein [Ktedonobacteraceae bacterium]
MEADFLVQRSELTLRFQYPAGQRQLAFEHTALGFEEWRAKATEKLADSLLASHSLLGETIGDLLRWEQWLTGALADERSVARELLLGM